MPIGYKIVQKALLNIFLELHSLHKKLLQSPLLQKVSLVHKKSAGTSENVTTLRLSTAHHQITNT